jgi:cell division protease FtsH
VARVDATDSGPMEVSELASRRKLSTAHRQPNIRARPANRRSRAYNVAMDNLPPPPPPPPPGRGRASGPQADKERQKNNNRSQGGEPDGDKPAPTSWRRWWPWVAIGLFIVIFASQSLFAGGSGDEITYTEFISLVNGSEVEKIEIDNATGKIKGELTNGTQFRTTGGGERGLSADDETLARSRGVDVDFTTPSSNFLLGVLTLMLPVMLIIGFFVWMQRRAQGQMGNVMSIGRSRAKTYSTDQPSTTFADIAGYEGVKTEINEVVDFLRMPERFKEIGARVPKGILLVGPPGTGKTLFARAVAGEAGVGFLSVTGSDFMEMFVGVGASRVRDLFQQARRMGKAIIFIDEIDSIGRKRGAGLGGGHDEREQTLNQMLSEMDGFETSEGIVIMAATNRPDILDPALLRPGRFDRQIVVPLPEHEERKAILAVHSRDKRMGSDVDLDIMAKATPGMAGADLANLVNEAALIAVRRGSKQIERIDFENARDRVVLGAQRESLIMTAEERKATAYHEGGHALLATVLLHGDPLHKVTILPRGMALGVTWSLPQERHTYSKDFFDDTICKAMGGRVAEMIVFGQVNSGAANDLEQATGIARRMVREWGMSDEVGPMAWAGQQQVFLGEDLMSSGREYSDDTARLLDKEIAKILVEQEERARVTLTKHRQGLELIAEALLEHETIDGPEVARLIQLGLDADGHNEKLHANVASATTD